MYELTEKAQAKVQSVKRIFFLSLFNEKFIKDKNKIYNTTSFKENS